MATLDATSHSTVHTHFKDNRDIKAITAMGEPQIAIVPSPGMGHLIPLVEFAKRLTSRFGFSVSLILPSSTQPTKAQTTFLNSLPPSISHTFLPPVDSTHLPHGVAHEVTIHLTHVHSLPSLRAALSDLAERARIVALVTDLFGTDYFDVARELRILPYMYFTTNAMCLLFLLNVPRLDETVSCEYRDMPDPLVLPGCMPLYGKDFVDPCMDRKDESYRVLLHHVKRYVLAEGIFVNTFFDLERGTIRALQTEDPNWPPVYPVGPIIQSAQSGKTDGSDCLKWLDRQPAGSVLYVSFGSGGTLSKEQLNELATGLEKSGQRFLWVVRSPNDHSSFGSFFSAQSEDDPLGFLPDGYLNRIKDRGLLVPSWAPQIRVLSHGSTGGFLTHCGWNSVLESIINGVPLIAWPLYAEQRMNALMLNQGLKVALRPNADERGLVEAGEIGRVAKELMEGDEGHTARNRMKELSDLAKKAISEDGDSSKSLAEVAKKWSQNEILQKD
uniref:Glycosyltransferase n=1 Tax=Opuntia streptacantha TaxID=393608 RepID=A0A7C8ZGD2_OPUST